MPEGHTIHREARLQEKYFAGTPLDVTSPQGRFSADAKRLDGTRSMGSKPWASICFTDGTTAPSFTSTSGSSEDSDDICPTRPRRPTEHDSP